MSEFLYRQDEYVLVADMDGKLSKWVITHVAKLWDGVIVYTMREHNEATLRLKFISVYEADLKPWTASKKFGYVASLYMKKLGEDKKEHSLDIWLGT